MVMDDVLGGYFLLGRSVEVSCVCRLRDGIYNVLSISSLGNQFIQANKPWDLLKGSDEDRSVSLVTYVFSW